MTFFQPGAVLNTQAFGNRPEVVEVPFIANRAPSNTQDILYPVGKRWIYQGNAEYVNLSFSTSSGNLVANWVSLGGGTGVLQNIVTDTGGSGLTGATINLNSANPFVSGTTAHCLLVQNSDSTHGTIALQIAGSQASTSVLSTNLGICMFNSAQFSIDANGFVSLTTSPGSIVQAVLGDDGGANQVVPNGSGQILLAGVTVANGTNAKPLYFKKTATNTESLDIQLSTTSTSAAKNINNAGLSSFDSNAFSIDSATGFISLTGGSGPVVFSLTPDTGTSPVTPSSGTISLKGGTTFATGTQANPILTNGVGAHEIDLQIQLAGSHASSSTPNNFGVAQFDSNQFNVSSGFVQLAGGTTAPLLTLSDDTNTQVSPSLGNIQLVGHVFYNGGISQTSTVVAGSHLLNVNPMSPARWIVDPLGFNGTHTTLTAALASASSGETIFLLPGVYTENISAKAGVNIAAFDCDALTPNVTIKGKVTATFAGTCTFSGIRFQTNGDYFLSISGSSATNVNFKNCFLNMTNNTGILITSTGGPTVQILHSQGDTGTSGIALFSASQACTIIMYWSDITNSGGTTTASTISAGQFAIRWSRLYHPVYMSGTAIISGFYAIIDSNSLNVTMVSTVGASSSSTLKFCDILSGTATAIAVGGGTTITIASSSIQSNTGGSAISGTGTCRYCGISWLGSNSTIGTSVATHLPFTA